MGGLEEDNTASSETLETHQGGRLWGEANLEAGEWRSLEAPTSLVSFHTWNTNGTKQEMDSMWSHSERIRGFSLTFS